MKNLREFRLSKKWTRKVLSEKAQVSTASIVRYENGTRTPPIDAAFRLARALEITMEQLIDDGNLKHIKSN